MIVVYNTQGDVIITCDNLENISSFINDNNHQYIETDQDINFLTHIYSCLDGVLVQGDIHLPPSLEHQKEAHWETIRSERGKLLVASDWTQLPDIPTATRELWSVYRQALRDITLQEDPYNLTYPTKP